MPLAEAPYDQTVLSGAGVKPRQHMATPPFESSLKVPRMLRDLRRVYPKLCALVGRRRLEPDLGGGFISQNHEAKRDYQLANRFVDHDEYLAMEPESATPATTEPLKRYRMLLGGYGPPGEMKAPDE